MGISESQLETWSHQGAVTTAKATHESIRNALDSYGWPNSVNFEVYLQGSYKNDTNIRRDMDVDVVVELNSTFFNNLSKEQQERFGFIPANYTWIDFRKDALNSLIDYYDRNRISEGNKSIKVQTSYLPADVVVCIQYRKYPSHPVNESDFAGGMTFCTRNENRQVINYPKIHYDNGVKKHQITNNQYKPTVRMFKNIRNYLVEKNYISKHLAPSYFLECLLYNVPNIKFEGTYQEKFRNIVNWLSKANLGSFVCQNEQLDLFGNSPEQWSVDNAKKLIENLIKLWENW